MSDVDVIVIGAGCGGLSAGALLAGEGRRVVVVEQNTRIGGCCSTFESGGFKFDVGASIVEIVEPIRWVFERLGTRLEDEIDLIPCDPLVTAELRDGRSITYPKSANGTRAALAEISLADAAAWDRYEPFFHELTDVAYATLFSEPANTVGDLLRWFRKEPRLVKFLPAYLRSYESFMRSYFSDAVCDSLAFQSFYFGLPPELLPGLFALVPATEHRGIYYPRGGMIKIPEALQRVGERSGLDVRLGNGVEQILVRDRRVYGVELSDGDVITAPVVVSNVNAKRTYERLVGVEHLPRLVRRGVRSYPYSMACMMIYLGLDEAPPLAGHHTLIAPTVDEINTYFRNRSIQPVPAKHFGLVACPTLADPSLAPDGKHVLALTMGGFSFDGIDWDHERKRVIDDVIHFLSQGPVPDLDKHVEVALATTPLDFDRELGVAQGAIYGLEQSLPNQTVFRPANKSKSIRGLYLAGSSTNPGGGVPTVIASGAITARLVSENES
jgi:phytoene desaturase